MSARIVGDRPGVSRDLRRDMRENGERKRPATAVTARGFGRTEIGGSTP